MIKMAENPIIITFESTSNAINSNCVEVANKQSVEETTENDITNANNNDDDVNKEQEQQSDEPQLEELVYTNEEKVLTSDDAAQNSSAGTSEETVVPEEKKPKVEEENLEEKLESPKENEETITKKDDKESKKDESAIRLQNGAKFSAQYLAKTLKKRSIRCLNKMRVMEDVREGCDLQPSSPGHADQGATEASTNPGEVETRFEKTNGNSVSKDPEEVVSAEESPETKDMIEIKKEIIEEPYSSGSESDKASNKRKSVDDRNSTKKICTENYDSRDKLLGQILTTMGNNELDQIHTNADQVIADINVLNELAKEKEREWNNIIYQKKLKEELLLRIQRRKQVIVLSGENKIRQTTQTILRTNNMSITQKLKPYGRDNCRKTVSPRPFQQQHIELNGSLDLRQPCKQRPVLDVQTIIADHRQRHPEVVPRRGRRIRNSHGLSNGNILNFSSITLGSGAQVRQNQNDVSNDLDILLNALEKNRLDANDIPPNLQDCTSFKDMLVQFAKLSQTERNELIQNAIRPPPPYPEVTMHPVSASNTTTSNSLLHGILTKNPPKSSKSSFSPTLARLLTTPERSSNNHVISLSNFNPNTANMSLSEILHSNKDDDETEDSADRLVIDESNETAERRGDSDVSDEVPQCQGCNQRTAQFVCAGCGNQWYCSRDCQVQSWDEHSEACSG